MSTNAAPVYVHDCGPEHGCRFLGSMTAPAAAATPDGVRVVDLWVHDYPDRPGYRSLIYRWSDDGPEYASAPLASGLYTVEDLADHPVYAELLTRLRAADARTVTHSPAPPA